MSNPTRSNKDAPKTASVMTGDERRDYKRWSILYNKVRFEFFGATLDEAEDMFKKIKRQMDAEFVEKREAFKGDKEKVDRLNAREKFWGDRYNDMTELLGKLKGGQTLSHNELGNFSLRLRLKWTEKLGDPENGQAERQFKSLVDAVASKAQERYDYEAENRYDLPYNDSIMVPVWKQKLQEFFRKNDVEYAQDIKKGLTDKDVEANLSKRVAQAVTAIYSGKLELPGLEIDDCTNKPDAPYQTAKRLIQAVDPYVFLDHATRCYYIPNVRNSTILNCAILDEYDTNKKNGGSANRIDSTVDAILNGNYKARQTLEELVHPAAAQEMKYKVSIGTFQLRYLNALDAQIQELNDKGKQQEQFKADFKELEAVKSNTVNFTEDDRKNPKVLEEKKQAEEKMLLDEYSEKWMYNKTEFNDKIKAYWSKLGKGMRVVGAEEIEKSIAAHLCSAYEPYQERSNEKTTDVLTLHHQPRVPINDESIKETVDYFKIMCRDVLEDAENRDAIKALDNVSTDRIKQYYDSFILSREAKLQEEKIKWEYDALTEHGHNVPDYTKDSKLKSYVRALSEKFFLSEKTDLSREDAQVDEFWVKKPTMISPIERNEEGKYDWYKYLKNLVVNNNDLAETVREKIQLPITQASVSNLTNGFSQSLENPDNYGSGGVGVLKGGKPNFASHNAKLGLLENVWWLSDQSRINSYTRETINKDVNYQKDLQALNEKYENVVTKGTLVNTASYNKQQRDAFIEEEKKLSQNSQDVVAEHQKTSADLTQTSNELLEESQKTKPRCTRKEMLNMLLTTIGETDDPAAAKKKVMASSKKIKRYFFHVWFGAYRNPASTRLRTLLNGLAAKPKDAEINPDELMDLHKAAKDLKFSIDGGKNLSDDKLKKLNSYDKDRYALAIKVQTALEKNFKDEKNMLFKDAFCGTGESSERVPRIL